MTRTISIYREIRDYFFLRKVINREARKKDPRSLWKVYNLRKNWYGRIYTVVSLREEEMGEEEIVKNWIALEKMKPINDYLLDLNLHEIIFPSIEKIPNSRSYLVVYSPLFKETTLSWFLWRIFYLAGILAVIYIIVKKW